MIVDDWWIDNCRRAIEEFRELHGLAEPIIPIDADSAYWVKTKAVQVDPAYWTGRRAHHF